MTIRSVTLALAAASAFIIPTAAFAGTRESTESVTVEYKDLNLASASGQQELDRRLDKAARQVCGMDDIKTGTRLASRDARECYEGARTQLGASLSHLTRTKTEG